MSCPNGNALEIKHRRAMLFIDGLAFLAFPRRRKHVDIYDASIARGLLRGLHSHDLPAATTDGSVDEAVSSPQMALQFECDRCCIVVELHDQVRRALAG